MGHPILLSILGGFIISRLILRARMRRAYGGGCGRFAGPLDLGAPDGGRRGDMFPPWGRRARHFRRWARWQADANQRQPPPQPRAPIDLVGALELNQRQRELYDDVLAKARQTLRAGDLAEALALAGREPFDRQALGFLVGGEELVDDFEHLHHSLTAEQRARLREVTSA